MTEELDKPMPHAERQALLERLKAEGVALPSDVKNHVVNGGASAQKVLAQKVLDEWKQEQHKPGQVVPIPAPQAEGVPLWLVCVVAVVSAIGGALVA